MYKIQKDPFDGSENVIIRKSDGAFIPKDDSNRDYKQFVDDIYTNGIGIVEGADYVGVTTYTEARREEYPSIEDQLDKIYHSGVNAWKADIKIIKDKYPKTQVGITSIAPIPDWLNTVLFDKQKEEYIKAKARLEQYELSAGLKDETYTTEVTGETTTTTQDINTPYIIEPLPISIEIDDGFKKEYIRNPLVVQDETERAASQQIINNTPKTVIDSVSS